MSDKRAAVALLAACCALSSCGSFDREYRLRSWEKCRIASEQALHKKRNRLARSMAEEAVYQARGFGDFDFRLGVSLCDLADALKAEGKSRESEDAYRQAEEVLRAAGKIAEKARTESEKAGRTGESQTNEVMCRLAGEDLANTISHMGDLYAMQERNQDAARCFKEASGIYQSVLRSTRWSVDDCPTGQSLVQCLTGLAQVSIALSDYDAADEAYKRALNVAVASNSPEFVLCEIRDSYLKLLQRLGRTSQAAELLADELYTKYTSEGMQAMFRQNYSQAETLFAGACSSAQKSIFSQRRLMRALFNLQNVYAAQHKFSQMESTFGRAVSFVQSRGLRFDGDFDQMLTIQARFCLQTGRTLQAAQALEQQLRYRLRHYGSGSIEVCETLALKGEAELHAHNLVAAERSATSAYRAICKKYMTDRRAAAAMSDTAQLMVDLNHFEEAELLSKQSIENKLTRMEKGDVRMVGMKASLFVLYFRFKKHEQALKVANDIVAILKNGDRAQKAQSMPYLILVQSYALVLNWYDIAEEITICGQSIMRNELAGAELDAMNQANWSRGLAKLEKHSGRKF